MSQEFEVLNYIDEISEEREYCTLYLSEKSKLNVFLHPFKTIKCKYRLRKLDIVDNEFKMVVASCFNKDDYRKQVKTFITSHPLTAYKRAV